MATKKEALVEALDYADELEDVANIASPFATYERLTDEDVRRLTRDFPADEVDNMPGPWNKEKGEREIIQYLAWPKICSRIEEVDPAWEHHITKSAVIPMSAEFALIQYEAALTIKGVTKSAAAGLAINNPDDFERALKNAETDALKRAAAKFGVGRSLYLKEGTGLEAVKAKIAAQEGGRSSGGGGASRSYSGGGGGGGARPLTDNQRGAIEKMAKARRTEDGNRFQDVDDFIQQATGREGATLVDAFTKPETDAIFQYQRD